MPENSGSTTSANVIPDYGHSKLHQYLLSHAMSEVSLRLLAFDYKYHSVCGFGVSEYRVAILASWARFKLTTGSTKESYPHLL